MKKRVFLCLALVLVLCCASACAQQVNIAYMPNYASLYSVVTGIEMGYFEDEGLSVRLIEFSDGPTIIAAMESGAIDMGYIGPGAHKLCIQGYAQVFCMSHIGNADAVLGFVSKGVTTVADLKGKRVGYASGTSSETILNLALHDAGLTFDDIIPIEMDASALVTASLSGKIDACACWSPASALISNRLRRDVVVLANNETFADRTPNIASWICGKGYYAAHQDTVLRFTRALYRAMDYHMEHQAQVCDWVSKVLGEDPDVVYAQIHDGHWIDHHELLREIQDGTMRHNYLLQHQDFLLSGIENPVDVDDYVLFDNMLLAGE